MTLHELTTAACARLQHWWELHGSADDPTEMIRRIATELAPPDAQMHLEADLNDFCAQLYTFEGGNDDHA